MKAITEADRPDLFRPVSFFWKSEMRKAKERRAGQKQRITESIKQTMNNRTEQKAKLVKHIEAFIHDTGEHREYLVHPNIYEQMAAAAWQVYEAVDEVQEFIDANNAP